MLPDHRDEWELTPPQFHPVTEFDLTHGSVLPGRRLRAWSDARLPDQPERDRYVAGEFRGYTSRGDLIVLVDEQTTEPDALGCIGTEVVVVRPGAFGVFEFPGRVEVQW